MVVTVELGGVLEEVLDALVAAGLYQTKTEAVRDAVRRFVESLDLRDVAFRLYRAGAVTFQYAAEVARVGFRELASYFLSRGLAPELGSVDRAEVEGGARSILESGLAVLDLSAFEALVESGLVEVAAYRGWPEFLAPSSLSSYVHVLPYRVALVVGRAPGAGWVRVERAPVTVQQARRAGLTLQELEAVALAARGGGVLVSCDARTRALARLHGARAAPVLSLLAAYISRGLVDRGWARLALERLVGLPAAVGGAGGVVE